MLEKRVSPTEASSRNAADVPGKFRAFRVTAFRRLTMVAVATQRSVVRPYDLRHQMPPFDALHSVLLLHAFPHCHVNWSPTRAKTNGLNAERFLIRGLRWGGWAIGPTRDHRNDSGDLMGTRLAFYFTF
uniref:Uncharacterized protein n=1 Tax=Rhipicephalus zambeziensis TaxID=60191 RepID=A0A224YCY6_9ACAR